jgi:ATP-binding cassette subfamily C (CFTR/MRP) protein 4
MENSSYQVKLKTIFRSNVLRAVFYTFSSSFINTASFLAITTLLYTGHVITARNVFTVLTFMSIHPHTMYWCWNAVEYLVNVSVTIERIQNLLLNGETNNADGHLNDEQANEHKEISVNYKDHPQHIETKGYNLTVKIPGKLSHKSRPELCLSKATSKILNSSIKTDLHNENVKSILNEIDLQLIGSTLVAVIGKIGSGKSSLLNIILGELPLSQGEVIVKGTIAFVSQTAWLFSGTIRDNILFGSNFDEKRYDDVIRACALDTDFGILPHGDMTYVGERGVILSGGQRARVNLARAAYHDADIYLLDDPLSAIDSKVGRHVFNECIIGLLSNRLRVLVTHHVHYLNYVDEIVIMEKGSITKQATYDELQISDSSLKELMSTRENGKSESLVDEDVPPEKVDDERLLGPDDNRQEEEDREIGKITYKTYWKYLRSGSSIIGLVILLIMGLASQGKDRSI